MKNILMVIFVSVVLAGCSKEVSLCNDPAVAGALKDEMLGFLKALEIGKDSKEIPLVLQKGKKHVDGFSVTVTDASQEAYQKDADRRSCTALAEMGEPIKSALLSNAPKQSPNQAAMGLKLPLAFSLKGLADGGGKFKVELNKESAELLAQFSVILLQSVAGKVADEELAGVWTGDYSCSGLENATDGPQGPYKLPVVMKSVVNGTKAELTLDRTTAGGGIEKLKGVAMLDGSISLNGQGMNSPDDKWNTSFDGKIAAGKASAEGSIKSLQDEMLRSCKLNLTRG